MLPGTPTERETAVAALLAGGFQEIGRSVEGRPLVARRFGGPGTPLLVMGGIHGDEPASVDAVLDLLARFPAAPPVPLWLLPAANPDGLAAGRKNSSRDVDLNRNFPARSFRVEHQPGYFPGPAPLSEPETRAIHDLIQREGIGAAVAVHAPFACVNYDGPAAGWAETVARACGWPARGDIGYPTPGSFGAWFGADRGLPVLTIELPPGPLAGFREAAAAALDTAIAGSL